MCDCYLLKCKECPNEISIHVADFCTDRNNVNIYCPDCLHKIPGVDSSEVKIFVCRVEEKQDILKDGKPRRKYIGKCVIFIVTDMKAHGICLN